MNDPRSTDPPLSRDEAIQALLDASRGAEPDVLTAACEEYVTALRYDVFAFLVVAAVYRKVGRPVDSLAAAGCMLALEPMVAGHYRYLASLLEEQGKTEAAALVMESGWHMWASYSPLRFGRRSRRHRDEFMRGEGVY